MAFLNKVTAEDLKTAGFDPEAITASIKAVQDGSASKQDIVDVTKLMMDLKTSFEGYQTQMNTTLDEMKAKKNGNNNDNNNNNNNNNEEVIDPLDFMTDPAGNVKKAVAKELGTLQLQSIKLYSDMAYDNARRDMDNFPLFNRFKKEIDVEWEKYPLQYKNNPSVLIANIYKIAVANHLDELTTEASKNKGVYNLGSSGASGGGNPNKREDTPKPAIEQLTEAELKVARNMELTPEEYLKEKEVIHFV